MVHAGNEVRAHLQHEQGQGGGARDQDGAAQVADVGGAGGLFAVGGVEAGLFRLLQNIARLLHGGGQIAEGYGAREEADGGAFGGQIDAGAQDAGHGGQGLFHATDAAGAGHFADRIDDFFFHRLITGGADGGGDLSGTSAAVQHHMGAFGGQVDAGLGDAGHGADGLLDPADTAGAGHAEDRQIKDFQGGVGHRRSLSSLFSLILLILPIMVRSTALLRGRRRGGA
ncbi:hypothetical protein D3C80_1025560 [compost metagenome]